MTDVVVMWLMIVLALSLLCNLGYLCRDMAREHRRERRRAQRKGGGKSCYKSGR